MLNLLGYHSIISAIHKLNLLGTGGEFLDFVSDLGKDREQGRGRELLHQIGIHRRQSRVDGHPTQKVQCKFL